MTVSAVDEPSTATVGACQEDEPLSRFGFVTVVVLRLRQLRGGARPRVDAPGHKLVRVALLEVASGMVVWNLGGPVSR